MNDELEHLGAITPCYAVRFERYTPHSAGRLWRAITDPAEVERWMGYPARIDLRPGGPYEVDFGRTGDGLLDGVIIRVEPERLLRYAWGTSVVDWAITPEPVGCRHVFVHCGLTPQDVPDEEGLSAGWHDFLASLDEHLDGQQRNEELGKIRWQELKPHYRQQLEAVLGGALK